MRTTLILFTAIARAAAAPAPAQTTLTLDRAVELSLEANHLLKAAGLGNTIARRV